MKVHKIVIKILVYVLVTWNHVVNVMYVNPDMLNKLAVEQMTNSVNASNKLMLMSYSHNYDWVLLVVLFFVLFWDELSYLISKVKGEKKDEEV